MTSGLLKNVVSHIGSGITPSRSNKAYWEIPMYPWLKTEQLGEYKIFDTNEYISQAALDETSIKLWPPKTLSVALYGEGQTRGKTSIIMREMATNQACCNIIIDESKADYRYVYYWLKNNYTQLRKLSSGVRKNLNSDDIKSFPISYPSVPQQALIADVLCGLDEKIALNKQINAELEAMAKIIYDYWFVQFDFPDENGKPYRTSGGAMEWNEQLKREIPKGWSIQRLESCLSKVSTGLNPRDNFKLGNGAVKYITVKNLRTDGTMDFSNCDIVDATAQKIIHERSDISVGDILFASIAPLGRCYLILDTPNDWDINESVFSIRPNYSNVTSEYIYMYFISDSFISKASSSSTGSIFKGIRIGTLLDMPIIVPPKSVADDFSQKISKLIQFKHKKNMESDVLTSLRDWLLPLLMNGQATLTE